MKPESITARRSSPGRATVEVRPVGRFKGSVKLSSSLLFGTEMTFAPPAIDDGGTAELTVTPGPSAIKGPFIVTITAIDGGQSHAVTLNVTIR